MSRRTVVRGLLSGLLGGVVGGHSATAARGKDRVVICHRLRDGAKTITVGAAAVAAHLAHGDSVGACEAFCPPSQVCGPNAECCLDTNTECCGGVCCASEDCCYDGANGQHTCCPEGSTCWDPYETLCVPAGSSPCGETFCDRDAGECCQGGGCVSGERCFG